MIKKRIDKIKNLLSKEQTEILETALLLMIPSILTKFSGLFFNLIAASYFGTKNPGWNQFQLASSIPDMLTNVLLGGAISSVIIPGLIACRKRDGVEAFYKLYNSIINGLLSLFVIISLIFALAGDFIVPFLLKSLGHGSIDLTPSELSEVIMMMRVLLIPQIILGFSVLISSGLNIYNRYLLPQLAPLLFNLGRIFGLVLLVPLLNSSPWAIVAGVFAGSILHLIIQIPLFKSLGFKYELEFHWDKYLRQILFSSLPRTLALAAENIALTINDFLAFSISASSISALNYANSLSLVIPTIFAASFSYASFTILSELFADDNFDKARSVIIKTMNEILFLALPFIITLIILRVPIVRLIFGILPKTNFTLEATYQTAWVLLWFAVGHIFVCGRWFMYRVFYAAKDTFIPFVISGLSLIITVFLSIIFTNLFSHNNDYAISLTQINLHNLLTRGDGPASVGGIALGMSTAYSIEFFLLIFIFNARKMNLNLKYLFKTLLPKFISGGIMFILMYLMFKTWNAVAYALPTSANEGYLGSTTINLIFLTGVTLITSFMVYYLISLLFKVEELKILRKYLNPVFKLGGLRIDS